MVSRATQQSHFRSEHSASISTHSGLGGACCQVGGRGLQPAPLGELWEQTRPPLPYAGHERFSCCESWRGCLVCFADLFSGFLKLLLVCHTTWPEGS